MKKLQDLHTKLGTKVQILLEYQSVWTDSHEKVVALKKEIEDIQAEIVKTSRLEALNNMIEQYNELEKQQEEIRKKQMQYHKSLLNYAKSKETSVEDIESMVESIEGGTIIFFLLRIKNSKENTE